MPDVWHRHRYHGRRIRCYCRRRNIRIHCCYSHNHIHNYNGSIHIYKI